MVLLIGLTAEPRLREKFQRLDQVSRAILETKQASRGRLLDLLAEQEKVRREIEESLKTALSRVVRIGDELYRLLEEQWEVAYPPERLDAALYDAARGLKALEKVQRVLAGTASAADLERLASEIQAASPGAGVVFWATSKETAAAVCGAQSEPQDDLTCGDSTRLGAKN